MRGEGCHKGQSCAPQRHGPISGHRAPTAAVPRTHLDSLPAGDSDEWPTRPPGYLLPGKGPLPRPSSKGEGLQKVSQIQRHCPPARPPESTTGCNQREATLEDLYVVTSVGLEYRGLPLKSWYHSTSNRREGATTQCLVHSSSILGPPQSTSHHQIPELIPHLPSKPPSPSSHVQEPRAMETQLGERAPVPSTHANDGPATNAQWVRESRCPAKPESPP